MIGAVYDSVNVSVFLFSACAVVSARSGVGSRWGWVNLDCGVEWLSQLLAIRRRHKTVGVGDVAVAPEVATKVVPVVPVGSHPARSPGQSQYMQ